MPELTDIMAELGCIDAINGDDGSLYLLPKVIGRGSKPESAIAAKKKEKSKVAKPILIIDAGHGGKDPGGGTNQYWKEKDMTLQVSLYQQRRFVELGVPVAMTRTTDVYLGPEERTKLVKDSGAVYCISNHINAGGGDGLEVIHSIYGDDQLAKVIAAEINEVGQNLRRIFTRTYPGNTKKDYYYMHRDTGAVTTLIIEYGFADSKLDDIQQLRDYWQDYAEAVVKAFCAYTGHPYKVPAVDSPKDADPLPRVQKEIGIKFNGSLVSDSGYLINNRSYIPATLARQEGYEVDYDGQNVTIKKGAR